MHSKPIPFFLVVGPNGGFDLGGRRDRERLALLRRVLVREQLVAADEVDGTLDMRPSACDGHVAIAAIGDDTGQGAGSVVEAEEAGVDERQQDKSVADDGVALE